MRTTKETTKQTVSLRIDPGLLARVDKYCEHMRKVHKIEITAPAAMRALIEVGLECYESGGKK